MNNWKIAVHQQPFRKYLILQLAAIMLILACMSHFFDVIEARQGMIFNDRVLNFLPAVNVSVFILVFIWSSVILAVIRASADPNMFLTFLLAYILLCASRIVTISLLPLNAPGSLIALKDPLSNIAYNGRFITKDLFYSGHTSTLFLIFLCLKKRYDRRYVLAASINTGVLLLVQHVHYTIDVVVAPVFAFGCFWCARKVLEKRKVYIVFNKLTD